MEKELDQLIETLYGKIGTPARDAFEHDLAVSILILDTPISKN